MKGKFLSLGTVDTVGLIILWGWGAVLGLVGLSAAFPASTL